MLYSIIMTITQTVEIPVSHRLTIDVPHEIPSGRTSIIIQFPEKKEEKTESHLTPIIKDGKTKFSKKELENFLQNAHTPISDSLTGILEGLVPSDITIEQIRDERLAKYLK